MDKVLFQPQHIGILSRRPWTNPYLYLSARAIEAQWLLAQGISTPTPPTQQKESES